MRKIIYSLLIAAGLVSIENNLFGQTYDDGLGLIYGYVGTSFVNVQTTAEFEITSSSIPETNTTLQLERDINFPTNNSLFYVKFYAGNSFQITGSYLSLHRSGESYLTREFTFGDQVFNVGANVKGFLNTDIYSATLRYSLINMSKLMAGFSLGGRYLKMNAGIDASFNGSTFKDEDSFDVPVIVPGIHASSYIIPGLLLRGSLEYFELKISHSKGRVIDAQASAEYYILKYLGVGVGYSYSDYKGSGLPENSIYLKNIDYELKGFNVFAAVRF